MWRKHVKWKWTKLTWKEKFICVGIYIYIYNTEANSESSQTSEMEFFVKTVTGWKPLTILAKSSILDVSVGSEYASEK